MRMNWKNLFNLLIITVILILGVLFFQCNYAQAKDATLVIEFTPPSYDDTVNTLAQYELHVNKNPGGLVIDKVATLDVSDPTVTEWEAEVFDIPPGQELAWYLHAVYASGDRGVSPAYMYRLLGNGIIIKIRRIK